MFKDREKTLGCVFLKCVFVFASIKKKQSAKGQKIHTYILEKASKGHENSLHLDPNLVDLFHFGLLLVEAKHICMEKKEFISTYSRFLVQVVS